MKLGHNSFSTVSKWKPPEENRIKVNVDASLVVGSRSFAVGMIIRDHNGSFIQAKNVRYPGEIPVLEAEARGAMEAIN